MKASDIVSQMIANLPRYSPYFSNTAVPDSFSTTVGGLVTVHTATPHKIARVGDYVTLSGIMTPVLIATATLIGDDVIEFTTDTDHDLTLHPSDPITMVRITGTGYDEEYQLINVANRRKFKVRKTNQPDLPLGDIYLQQTFLFGYNGIQEVAAIVDANTFKFQLAELFSNPIFFDNSKVSTNARISRAISIDVAREAYTKQKLDEVWAFVVLDDFTGNKDRMNPLDTNFTTGQNADYRQRIISGFKVYIFIPNKGDILTKTSGGAARDLIEDVRRPLFRSLLGIDFGSGLAAGGQNVCTWGGDRFFDYTGAYYIHEFSFQQVFDITYGDTALVSDNRAFRDIHLTLQNQFSDVTEYTASINLDENP